MKVRDARWCCTSVPLFLLNCPWAVPWLVIGLDRWATALNECKSSLPIVELALGAPRAVDNDLVIAGQISAPAVAVVVQPDAPALFALKNQRDWLGAHAAAR